MPDSKPTQEEQARALECAREWAPEKDREGFPNLARCHLHATAELERAEERIRTLRMWFEELLGSPFDLTIGNRALDQDDKLARGEEEETEMENATGTAESLTHMENATSTAPKFTPKPGDRVVLKWSPDDADHLLYGQTETVLR